LLEEPDEWLSRVELCEEPPPQSHQRRKRVVFGGVIDGSQATVDPLELIGDGCLEERLFRRKVTVKRAAPRLQSNRGLDLADGRVAKPPFGEEAETSGEKTLTSRGCVVCNRTIIVVIV
jgi:hypothetical protein